MFGGNFQTWKLHSAQDYFMFFAYILAGVLVFWLIAKHMNKQRNHEKAVEKVSGRLKKICGKPGEVLKNATLNLPEGKMTFDVVLMDKRGVYLVRTYGWGIKIYGTPDGAMWRREDAKRKEEFENPLPGFYHLHGYLCAAKAYEKARYGRLTEYLCALPRGVAHSRRRMTSHMSAYTGSGR